MAYFALKSLLTFRISTLFFPQMQKKTKKNYSLPHKHECMKREVFRKFTRSYEIFKVEKISKVWFL